MSNLWDRFDDIASAEEVAEAKSTYEPIQAGDYKAKLEELTPAESQNGLPMLKGKFRTLEGNKVIFYNQMLQNLNAPNMTAVNIAEAVSFVGAVLGEEVEFKGLSALAELIQTIPMGGEYTVRVSYGKKDAEMKFPKLKIVGRANESVEDSDVPPFEV
jgi:hypothetical protein